MNATAELYDWVYDNVTNATYEVERPDLGGCFGQGPGERRAGTAAECIRGRAISVTDAPVPDVQCGLALWPVLLGKSEAAERRTDVLSCHAGNHRQPKFRVVQESLTSHFLCLVLSSHSQPHVLAEMFNTDSFVPSQAW